VKEPVVISDELIIPMVNAIDTRHWGYFANFCKLEIAAGGPDPHMVVCGHMSRKESWEERIWRGGVYVGVYNAPTAEQIWQQWPWERAKKEPISDWLVENWKGIATRRERRCVRAPVHMVEYFGGLVGWLNSYMDVSLGVIKRTGNLDDGAYEHLWERLGDIKYLGRYVRFKLLEYWRRYAELPLTMPDIRPRGGWSPRETLAMLYPQAEGYLNAAKDAPETLAVVNAIAENARQQLGKRLDQEMDLYRLEVLLCDYRQAYEDMRQYPGRSQDSELDYLRKIQPYWGNAGNMLEARAEIFPHRVLGELNGWDGVRKELGTCLRDHHYLWSDLLYDYKRTTNLACPWEWEA